MQKEVIAFYYKWKWTAAGRQVMNSIKSQRKGAYITEGGVQHTPPRSRDVSRTGTKRTSREDRDADWRETSSSKVRRSASTSASRSSRSDHVMRRKAEVESDPENDDDDEATDEDARGLPIVPSPPPCALHDECFKKQTGTYVLLLRLVLLLRRVNCAISRKHACC